MSMVGSIPTPYIWDDRADFRDIAKQIEAIYNLKVNNPEGYAKVSKEAREWVTSDESMMSARWMSKNVISTVEETLATWKPRAKYEFLKIEKLPKKKMVHPLIY
jgi:hypothetical protein